MTMPATPPPPALDLPRSLAIQAHANRLANQRLHAAIAGLSAAEWQAPRSGFFPSLAATLNHLLAVDVYYLDGLHRRPDGVARFRAFRAHEALAPLAAAQAVSDARLIAFCAALTPAGCTEAIVLDRGQGRYRHERVGHLLQHLFMHQTHHRGQAHAMLSSTAVAPPPLDDFLLPSDADCRVADMAALGWDEATVYGPPLPAPPGAGRPN